jgi:hypothetical protein
VTDIAMPPTSCVALLLGVGLRAAVRATIYALQRARAALFGTAAEQASVPAIIPGTANWSTGCAARALTRSARMSFCIMRMSNGYHAWRSRKLSSTSIARSRKRLLPSFLFLIDETSAPYPKQVFHAD